MGEHFIRPDNYEETTNHSLSAWSSRMRVGVSALHTGEDSECTQDERG